MRVEKVMSAVLFGLKDRWWSSSLAKRLKLTAEDLNLIRRMRRREGKSRPSPPATANEFWRQKGCGGTVGVSLSLTV